jgi:hypothetical protein
MRPAHADVWASTDRTVQVVLGATVLVVNVIAYALVFARTAVSRHS